VKTVDGKDIECYAQTVMVHGDTPRRSKWPRRSGKGWKAAGVKIAPMKELI